MKLPGARWYRELWAVWTVMFFVLEMPAVLSHHAHGSITLTALTLAIAPKWLLAMFLGWLTYHFLIQYR